jgi:tRNA (cmo5U34)-methyltransferase
MAANRGEVWKSASRVRAFLDGVRGGIPFAATHIEFMLRLLSATGRPLVRFLDLGCGDGVLSRAILDAHPTARGTLVDFSEPMLAESRRRLSDFADRVERRAADLGDPSWRDSLDGPFDAAVSGFAIHHLPDARKRGLYEEIFALLADGGLFVNIEHVASPSRWIAMLADDHLIDSLYAFRLARGATTSRDEIAEEYLRRPDKQANILAPVENQCAWLREIGYTDVDCWFKAFELAVFGGRRPTR